MIVTLTMNATIDKTYMIPDFQAGQLHRVKDMYSNAGGKGINVARVMHALNEEVLATGIVAGFNGSFIEAELTREGIPHEFVRIEGESRVSINLLDPVRETQSELLEAGPWLDEAGLEAIKCKVTELAGRASHVVMSGSLLQGCPVSLYAELVQLVRAAGAWPVLDASGDALVHGAGAHPMLMKPNEHEVLKLTGGTSCDETSVIAAIERLMGSGVPQVVVSLGGEGAIAGMDGRLFRVTIPKVQVVSAVGCGDSMLAGLVVAHKRGMHIEDQLRMGAACGTANALLPEAGTIRLADVARLMEQVQITEL